MSSSTSTQSTLSGLSGSCVSEAGSSRIRNRNSTDESQEEECPKCAAMKLNTAVAEKALAALSGQLKNLQRELKKTEQVSKINEEQARYIDERRSKLEKLEAERTALYADFENLRINHDNLRRQYDEVIATARKNQQTIEEAVKYRETCKVAVENLLAEKEARQTLLSKYLKSVEAAAKINDSVKQLEKKCAQLQSTNEKLEPFRYHCPAMFRLLLEFGEIIENNGLMTKSLQRRFVKYKESDDLREYLLRKTRRLQSLSESSAAKTMEECSDGGGDNDDDGDDEIAKGVEDLLMTAESPLHLGASKKEMQRSSKKESESKVVGAKYKSPPMQPPKPMDSSGDAGKTCENVLRKQPEPSLGAVILQNEPKLSIRAQRPKTLRERQLELIEKQKQEALQRVSRRATREDAEEMLASSPSISTQCSPSTSTSFLVELEDKEEPVKEKRRDDDELKKGEVTIENRKPEQNLKKGPEVTDEEGSRTTNILGIESANRNAEKNCTCRCDERLSEWLRFAQLDPLLPELSKPSFLTAAQPETSKQQDTDDYMSDLFGGPLSPSVSSRRTSISSSTNDGFLGSKNRQRTRSKSGMSETPSTVEEINLFGEPLSPSPAPESPTKNAAAGGVAASSGLAENLGPVHPEASSSSLDNVPTDSKQTNIRNKKAVELKIPLLNTGNGSNNELKEGAQNVAEVSDESKETLPSQRISENTETQSTCNMTLRSRIRQPRRFNFPQSEDESTRAVILSPKQSRQNLKKPRSTGKELDDERSLSQQQPSSPKTVSGRATIDRKRKKDDDANLIRFTDDKVGITLKMVKDVRSKLVAPTEGDVKSGNCDDIPSVSAEQQPLLRRSARQMKRVRIESSSSESSERLMIDAKGTESERADSTTENSKTVVREIAGAEFKEIPENRISPADDDEPMLAIADDIDSDSNHPPENITQRKLSSESNETVISDELEISSHVKSENQSDGRKRIRPPTVRKRRRQSTRSSLNESKSADTAAESSSEINKIKETKATRKQAVRGPKRQKIAREESEELSEERKNTHQSVSMSESLDEKKQKDEGSSDDGESTNSNLKLLGMELSDSDDGGAGRLAIVTDEITNEASPSVSANNESDISENKKPSGRTPKLPASSTATTKKPAKPVRSEMYKKMHKRLAIQTSCMKDLGRVQIRKPANAKESNERKAAVKTAARVTEAKTVERTETTGVKKERTRLTETAGVERTQGMEEKKVERTQVIGAKKERQHCTGQKREAIMLPVAVDVTKKVKDGSPLAVRQAKAAIGTKVPVASDEAAVMCLFDQALIENSYGDKLLEIVQKFQAPAISAMPCEKLAECCVKFINKLDVGNMWHSVVLAVRYWSERQNQSTGNGKVLELHQVSSAKERNFIEVLHQLSGEEHWSDIILHFLRKMMVSLIKTRLVSVAQHGRNVRCILICTRILLQDGSNEEMLNSVSFLLHHLIERDTSDKVVPMMCYAVAIVPEIVDRLLLEENVQYEPMRRVMSIHLAARDELFTVFNKIIMSRLNRRAYSRTCLQKVDCETFHGWFAEAVNTVASDRSDIDLESMEFQLNPELSSAVKTCYALFNLAAARLIRDKEAMAFSMLDECVRIIAHYFTTQEKETNKMFADTTGPQMMREKELTKTIKRLLLLGRLITSLIRSSESCLLTQISNLAEEIYKFREIVRLKLEQGDRSRENRLLYFGLNDWLRVMKPATKYLQATYTQGKDSER